MTCVVGMIDGDGDVIIGGDSAGVCGHDVVIRKDPKVFESGRFLFGFTSSFRMGQVLQYSFKAPDHDPRVEVDVYMRTAWIDALRKAFESGGYAKKDNGREEAGTFLVGYSGRLFEVDCDYQVGESVAPYAAVGSGHAIAKGAMFALLESPVSAEQKIRKALMAAAQHSSVVRPPFVIRKLSAI